MGDLKYLQTLFVSFGSVLLRSLISSRSLSNNLITDVADNAFNHLGDFNSGIIFVPTMYVVSLDSDEIAVLLATS
jgi:hypothetical protein